MNSKDFISVSNCQLSLSHFHFPLFYFYAVTIKQLESVTYVIIFCSFSFLPDPFPFLVHCHFSSFFLQHFNSSEEWRNQKCLVFLFCFIFEFLQGIITRFDLKASRNIIKNVKKLFLFFLPNYIFLEQSLGLWNAWVNNSHFQQSIAPSSKWKEPKWKCQEIVSSCNFNFGSSNDG